MPMRNLTRRKGRTTMVIMAVAISTALLVSMLSVAGGLYNALIDSQESDLQDIIVSGGSRGLRDGHAIADDIESKAGVRASVPVLSSLFGEVAMRVPGSVYSLSPLIRGYVPGQTELFFTKGQLDTMEGGLPTLGDPHFNGGKYDGPWTSEAIINTGLAQQHSLVVGSSINLSGNGFDKVFTVTGIVEVGLTGSGILKDVFMVFTHLSELQSLAGAALGPTNETLDLTDEVVVALDQEVRIDKAQADTLVDEIKADYPFYSVATREGRLQQFEEQSAVANGFYTALGSVSVIIGLLFVATVMLISVYERTNEIGMMRAIGISRKTIFKHIYTEALAIVGIGAVVGLIPGIIGTRLLESLITERIGVAVELTTLRPEVLISSLALVIVLGSMISLYPAWKASRFNIISALREVK